MRKGFSLIELLVVIAIIAVLAAVALPVYSQYRTRSQVLIAYNYLLNNYIVPWKLYFAQNGRFPLVWCANDTPPASSLMTNVNVCSGGPNFANRGYAIGALDATKVNGIGTSNSLILYIVAPPAGNTQFTVTTSTGSKTYGPYAYPGALLIFCGRWNDSDTYFLPFSLQPASCQTNGIAVIDTNLSSSSTKGAPQ